MPSKTLFEMIRQVWLIKKRSRSHPSGCSVPEVRKSKVFQAVQLGNFPACQPLQLGYEVLAVLPRIPILLSNLSLKILGFALALCETQNFQAQIFLPASAAVSQATKLICQTKAKKLLFGRPAWLLLGKRTSISVARANTNRASLL